MQNNVGIYASQISGHLWAPNGAYDALATVTVPSGGVASVTFAGIPQGYKHLQIRAMTMHTATSAATVFYTGTGGAIDGSAGNYNTHRLTGNGSAASAAGYTAFPQFAWVVGNSSTSIPQVFVLDLLDYANTTKNKTIRALSGVDNNGSGEVNLTSGLWRNTSAIDTIQFAPNTGSFGQYSSFALYGVK